MADKLTCQRNVKASEADDERLDLAASALSQIRYCCGDPEGSPSAPHENSCGIGWALHWLEYHAGILSQPPETEGLACDLASIADALQSDEMKGIPDHVLRVRADAMNAPGYEAAHLELRRRELSRRATPPTQARRPDREEARGRRKVKQPVFVPVCANGEVHRMSEHRYEREEVESYCRYLDQPGVCNPGCGKHEAVEVEIPVRSTGEADAERGPRKDRED